MSIPQFFLSPDEGGFQGPFATGGQTFHGLCADVHDCGDLGVRQPLNMTQHHCLPLAVRQGFESVLQREGIPHRFEEFDGTHSGIDYRMDVSLPYLYKVLSS